MLISDRDDDVDIQNDDALAVRKSEGRHLLLGDLLADLVLPAAAEEVHDSRHLVWIRSAALRWIEAELRKNDQVSDLCRLSYLGQSLWPDSSGSINVSAESSKSASTHSFDRSRGSLTTQRHQSTRPVQSTPRRWWGASLVSSVL